MSSFSSSSAATGAAASQLQLGALVLASLVVGAAGWSAAASAPGRRGGSSWRLGALRGGGEAGWRATNLRDLRGFEVEEVLSDEASPAPDGYTVYLGRFAWQVRVCERVGWVGWGGWVGVMDRSTHRFASPPLTQSHMYKPTPLHIRRPRSAPS